MAQYSTKRQNHYESTNNDLHEVVMMADKDGNILNSFGISSNIPIAAGNLEGWSMIHKFGAVASLANNSSGTIWDRDTTYYPWSTIDNSGAGTTVTISVVEPNNEATTSTAEDGKSVTIIGLDADFNETSETIAISGSSGTGSVTFRRIYRAYVSDTSTNTKRILIKVGAVVVCSIRENKGQTLMAIYTVPAGKTAYLTKGTTSCQASADGTVDMFVRYGAEGAFRIGHTLEVSGTGGQYTYEFSVPIRLPEKTDVDIRATTRSNNGRFTSAFDLILVDN